MRSFIFPFVLLRNLLCLCFLLALWGDPGGNSWTEPLYYIAALLII